MDERLTSARAAYEQAVFGGDPSGLAEAARTLDGVEADLALASGRLLHAALLTGTGTPDVDGSLELALFDRAAQLYQARGAVRDEAEALFWVGAYHQVAAGDHATANQYLERSLALARRTGDALTASYALRHLGISAHQAGRLALARARLEESTELRRGLEFWPGVAANLVGMAYLAGAEQRPDDVRSLLDEAGTLARTSGAHGVLASVREAQAVLVEVAP